MPGVSPVTTGRRGAAERLGCLGDAGDVGRDDVPGDRGAAVAGRGGPGHRGRRVPRTRRADGRRAGQRVRDHRVGLRAGRPGADRVDGRDGERIGGPGGQAGQGPRRGGRVERHRRLRDTADVRA